MKKRLLSFAAALSAAGAWGYAIDTTHDVFYFEEFTNSNEQVVGEVKNRNSDGAGWLQGDTIDNVTNNNLTSTSQPNFYRIIIQQPGVAVKAWGLSPSRNIANANWLDNTTSTNFLCAYDSAYATVSPIYLYVWLKWMRYSLQFNSNGGSVMSDLSNICYTNSIALPTPSRTGYEFQGWTNSVLTTALTGENTGAELQVQEDGETVVLYAKWEPKTFKVTFSPNGEGATVDPAETTVTYDSVYDTLPTPVWADHAFAGWFTDATDGTPIQSNTVVSITANQTLYAHWNQLFTVTFQNTEGSIIYRKYTNVVSGSRVEPPDISEVMAPEGQTFGGQWNSSEYENVTRNLIIFPVFSDIETILTVACDPTSGGSYTIDNNGAGLYQYGRKATLTATPNEAYDFAGWSDGSMDNPYDVWMITSTNLIAQFTLKKFTVDFMDWDGTTTNATRIVEYGSAADAPTPIEHPGYTFTGWSADVNSVTSNMTVVAQYAANQYVVIYDANGGVGSMTNEVFTYGLEYQLQSNTYTRAVSQFFGWAPSPDATTNEVYGAIVSNLTTVANGTNTLYAVWSSQLSDLSVAANCTNLILVSNNGGWCVDNDVGFESPSSAHILGSAFSRMTTMLDGVGTLTFRVRSIRTHSDVDAFDYFEGESDAGSIKVDNTSGEWILFAYSKADLAAGSFTWRYAGYYDDDQYWVDQVHWYSGKSVTVPGNTIDSSVKNEVTEAILQNWDMILGLNAASVSNVVATGADVTNAVALIAGGIMPDVDIKDATATLTFKNDGEIRKTSIAVPTVAGKEYTGQWQAADISATDFYTVQNEGGTTAGVYSVVLELTDTSLYCWAGGDSNPTSLTFTITQATNEWNVEPSMAGWTSGETPSEPNLGEAKFGTVAVTYGASGAERPSEPGEYEATFTVDETDNYSGLTKAVPFTISSASTPDTNDVSEVKTDVPVPTVAGKEYTGQWQAADISATDFYTVQNEGGTNAGVYTVTLTLIDTNSYCWAGGDSNPTSLTFTITRATNEWKVEPSMAGWTSGETPSEPNLGEAKFGTVAVTYGASGAERPSEPGKYEATFTVDETDNYSGLTKVVPFTISGSSDPISSDLSTWPHDGAYNPLVANVYDGFLLDADGFLSGIIQVKAAKQAVKTTTDRVTKEKTVTTNVAVTATVTDANGKKWSYSKGVGTVTGVVTGLVCTTKGVVISTFGVSLGANGLSGEWGDFAIVGARNGMGTKGDAMLADLETYYKKSWSVTFMNELGATRLQLVVGAKGSTKISGTTADGFKVSATVQGVMGEEAFFVPYRATLKSGKLSRTVGLLLALKQDGSVETLASDIGALKSGGPTTDDIEVLPYVESASSKGGEAYAGAVVLNDLAYPAKFAAKGLPAGLKIDAATGAITGTPTKPGHYVATITITSGINAKAKTETVVEFDIANFTDGEIRVADAYGPYRVGVKVFESINDALGCTVSGLPAGLKFAAKETKDATFGDVPAGTIYGVPTKAVTNTVYFKKSTKETVQGKTVTVNHQASATFPVDPLSAWAQGTFNGAVDLGVASPSGLVTFTVSAAGKVSGKWLEDGLTWTLAAAAYDSYDAGTDEYVAAFVGKSGKLAFTNEVIVSAEALGDSARGVVKGDGLAAWQNLWKTETWKTAAKPFANKTLVLSGVKDGLPTDGDSMTLKFAATGAVTAKFGTYSCSSVLIPDDGEGHYYRLFLYFPPKAGKFDGYTAEVSLVWDGEKFTLGE